jgi:hypothetical protein
MHISTTTVYKCVNFDVLPVIIFRLSYKISVSDKWIRIEESPKWFQCPETVADPEDFCYDLKDLNYGTQYSSDVSFWDILDYIARL